MVKIYNNWHYHKDNNDSSNSSDPLLIIKDVCDLMLKSFDEHPDKELLIIDNPQLGHPMCLKDNSIIFLSTAGNTYWAQNAYQLTHELCHYFIKKKATKYDNSWLEESICELASIYFLSEIAVSWSISDDIKKSSYSSSITDYVSDLLNPTINVDLKYLGIKGSTLYEEMNSDTYIRDKNNFIANKLLPIFQMTPSLWEDVYLIRKFNIKDLNSFFDDWSKFAKQDNKEAIFEIQNLFL